MALQLMDLTFNGDRLRAGSQEAPVCPAGITMPGSTGSELRSVRQDVRARPASNARTRPSSSDGPTFDSALASSSSVGYRNRPATAAPAVPINAAQGARPGESQAALCHDSWLALV